MLTLGKTTQPLLKKMGVGCMSWSEFYGKPISDEQAMQLMRAALKRNIHFFDTADVYAYGHNEKLIGRCTKQLLIEKTVTRKQLVIASKCGILRDKHDPRKRGIDNSYAYIIQACEASLARLGTSVGYIDLFYLHRVNPTQIDEAMQAMSELLNSQKIASVGLSEVSVATLQLANEKLAYYTDGKHSIAAVQTEYSLMSREVETNGVLEYCRNNHITFVAYSPLCRALLTGNIQTSNDLTNDDFRKTLPRFQPGNLALNITIVNQVEAMAKKKKCTTAQIALAWLAAQPGVVSIPGTTNVGNLAANSAALNIQLTNQELFTLNQLPSAHGCRYIESAMRAYGLEE